MEIEKKITEEAVGLSKEVYGDLAQPAISEIGKTAGGLTRVLLAPLNGLVWGYDKIVEKLDETVSAKLKKTSKEKLQTPPSFVAVPAIEAMRYAGETEELRNLYANLLANAMDIDTVKNVHPGFVDIIKNLTPDEAKLLTVFLNINFIPFINVKEVTDKITGGFITIIDTHVHTDEDYKLNLLYPNNMPLYFDNLVRIGLLSKPNNLSLTEENYIQLEACPVIIEEKRKIEEKGFIFQTERRFFQPTSFGRDFINTVVRDK